MTTKMSGLQFNPSMSASKAILFEIGDSFKHYQFTTFSQQVIKMMIMIKIERFVF